MLYDIYIKPTITVKGAKKGVLDNILNGINKQARRDRRIDDVLNEEENPKLNSTKTVPNITQTTYRKKRRGKWGYFKEMENKKNL